MSRSISGLALTAGAVAALAVAGQRVGLALAVVLLLLLAVAARCARRLRGRGVLVVLGAGLAVQPAWRDAGWVVTADLIAALVTAGALVTPLDTWTSLRRAALAPLGLVAGWRLVGTPLRARWGTARGLEWAPVLHGVGLGALGLVVFGSLFLAADTAFADLADEVVSGRLDAPWLLWRLGLAVVTVGVAGACAAASSRSAAPDPARRVPGAVELRVALGAVVALFAVFVAVQLRVLFGGAAYVRETTGLGLGEYARQGLGLVLVVVALTVAVVGVAGRRLDRVVRGELAALCLLYLVILASAWNRLDLVVDAYGLTRLRLGGEAVVVGLAVLLALVLVAGVNAVVARAAPRVALTGALAGVLAFSLTNPDGRVAARAVDQQRRTGGVDEAMLADLSADALPALRRLRDPAQTTVLRALSARLTRPDGAAGWNAARARAR